MQVLGRDRHDRPQYRSACETENRDLNWEAGTKAVTLYMVVRRRPEQQQPPKYMVQMSLGTYCSGFQLSAPL